MFSGIIKAIEKMGSFSTQDLVELEKRLQMVSLAKNTLLIREGQVCSAFYFVNYGRLRQYTITTDGKDITTKFFLQSDWVVEQQSFTSQTPSTTNIIATSATELVELSVHALHELIRISNTFFTIGRVLEHDHLTAKISNHVISPQEKYALVMQEKPQIIMTFPLKDIASYLKTTPETLSRVRKKINNL